MKDIGLSLLVSGINNGQSNILNISITGWYRGWNNRLVGKMTDINILVVEMNGFCWLS